MFKEFKYSPVPGGVRLIRTLQQDTAHNSIRIEKIRTKELIAFAAREISRAKKGQFIPITMQRAISHTHNPYADENDVSLLVAYQDDTCIGYFGIMPVMLRHLDRLFRVFWFTTWRVSPEFKGKSLGSRLMSEALALDQDYIIVGSGPARRVCRKFGFLEREPLVYFQVDLTGLNRLNPVRWVMRILRKSLNLFHIKIEIDNIATKASARVLSPVTKKVIFALLFRRFRKGLEGIKLREVERLERSPAAGDREKPATVLQREIDVINWMLEYPWILEPGQSATEEMDYYFSDVRPLFKNIAIEISDEPSGEYRGYMVMSVSKKSAKISLRLLDYSISGPSAAKVLLAAVIRYAREYDTDLMEIPEKLGRELEKTILGRVILRKKNRIYQFHPRSDTSPLGVYWREIELNYCDGDMAFS